MRRSLLWAQAHDRQPDSVESGGLRLLDAAVKVLTSSDTPMSTKAMIEAMATQGDWTSPGGATAAQTLYSALIPEIGQKSDASRFIKADKGLFGLKQSPRLANGEPASTPHELCGRFVMTHRRLLPEMNTAIG